MSMDFDDKQKCVEIWEMYTGQTTAPVQWNEAAADALATMTAEIRECSSAMNFVPRPVGLKPGWGWLIDYVYDVLQNRYSTNKGRLYEACITVATASLLKTEVEMALIEGK